MTDEHFEKAAQNPAQYLHVRGGNEEKPGDPEIDDTSDLQELTPPYELVQNSQMGDTGFEPVTSAV